MAGGNFPATAPALILLCGLPGAGKTTFAHELAQRLRFEHIESDAIRRALRETPAYTAEENAAVFARVDSAARAALASGQHALVDATNLTRRDRKRFYRVAGDSGAPVIAVRVTAPEEVIRERLSKPREGFSQAGVAVYERMRGRLQPIDGPGVVADSRFEFGPAIDLVLRLIDDHR
ncbi:MAG: ATP-binding protein [Dehalococcoidia bacterium]|nr:ATP-binding protein [Dehalococcoidia bacterium]